MKKCLICGLDGQPEEQATCSACGEATWEASAEETQEQAPAKRGPGRPKKSAD